MTDFINIPNKPTLGLGCWAIGGPFYGDGRALGWGEVDDATSNRAIATALDHGIRHFDTAQAYGTGHSETILGTALAQHPGAAIATKIGLGFNPDTKELTGPITDPIQLKASIDASRKRLQRDHIDLILLHLNDLDITTATPIFAMLQGLQSTGTIGAYGWSTDFPDRAKAFADQPGFTTIEHAMNVFFRADHLTPVVEKSNLLALIRSPLAMGILGGKYDQGTNFAKGDIRRGKDDWNDWYTDGQVTEKYQNQLNAVRDILTSGGRTLPQGALAWLWARSPNALPIPGFRTSAQVSDLCGALDHGPLTPDQMTQIEAILDRPKEGPPRAR